MVFGENDSSCLWNFLKTYIFWIFDHIYRTYNQIKYRNIWFAKVIIILLMTAQVLFWMFFLKKSCTLMPLSILLLPARAYSSSLFCLVITCNHLPFFKNFQIWNIFAQIFKYFAPFQHFFAHFLKNCTHYLTLWFVTLCNVPPDWLVGYSGLIWIVQKWIYDHGVNSNYTASGLFTVLHISSDIFSAHSIP